MVVGGRGFFGGALAEWLRVEGARPLIGSRRSGADLLLDPEDPDSIRAALSAGDVVVDAAGPFQARTSTLAREAVTMGFDLIDLSDSLDHFLRMDALAGPVESAGIRVLTSCSTVSTVTAALIASSGVQDPIRVGVFLAPTTKRTASPGTAASLRHSLGRPIRVLRHGRLTGAVGWGESRPFVMPPPVGRLRCHLMESVDAVALPRIWSGLREVEFWVDSRVPGLNGFLSLAARRPGIRRLVTRAGSAGPRIARLLGHSAGGMAIEIEDRAGEVVSLALVAEGRSYLTAVAPAALAARALAEDRFGEHGLVPHDRHVEPGALLEALRRRGIRCVRER